MISTRLAFTLMVSSAHAWADAPPVISAIVFSPDGELIATAEPYVVVVRHADKTLIPVARLPFAGGTALAFAPDGKRVAAGGAGGVRVFGLDGLPAAAFDAGAVRLLAWGSAGVVSATAAEVVIWDLASKARLATQTAAAVAIAPDGGSFAVVDQHGAYERPRSAGGHEWVVPDTRITIRATADGAERWTTSGINFRATLLDDGDAIVAGTSVVTRYHGGRAGGQIDTGLIEGGSAATHDGRRWAWIDGDYRLKVVDVLTGRVRLDEYLHGPARALAISPDGRRVVAALETGLAAWDVP